MYSFVWARAYACEGMRACVHVSCSLRIYFPAATPCTCCGFIAFANIVTHDYVSYFKIDARKLLSKLSTAESIE